MFKGKVKFVSIVLFLSCLFLYLIVIGKPSDSLSSNFNVLHHGKIEKRTGGGYGASNYGTNKDSVKAYYRSTGSPEIEYNSPGINRNILSAPERFTKDGVYIWCDPDGLWTLLWRGRERYEVLAYVTGQTDLIFKSALDPEIIVTRLDQSQLEIRGSVKCHCGIVQLVSSDDSLIFDVYINGKYVPDNVYIGSRLNNPKSIPLKLPSLNTSINNVILAAQFAKKQENNIDKNINDKSVDYEVKRPAPSLSHGGNVGGEKGKSIIKE